ncbi:MAG: chemotaxis protein CheW [Gemmatimonadaceae bacterium]|jgi:two-component system chemotaxis sensor kinase CheA|nr:chemotaxis protein CheW [Gemmatimonadaceae bacterium]
MHPDRLRALFLADGRECLAALDAALLVLERAPADAEARERAFRALHTLKGMTATLALDPLTALVHAGEEGLARARTRGHLSPSLREPYATMLRLLGAALDAVEQGEALDEASLGALTTTLRAVTAADDASPVSDAPQATTDIAPPAPVATTDGPRPRGAARPGAVRTARIPVERLDALLDLAGELLIARDRLLDRLPVRADDDAPAAVALRDAADAMQRTVDRVRDAVVTARLVPVSHVLDRLPRHVRDTASALGKDVELVVEGRELEVDRSLLDELGEPIVHLVRNALDHGIERPAVREALGKPRAGRLVLRAEREGDFLALTVADDGAGVDRAKVAARAASLGVADARALADSDEGLLALIARPGLSTAESVTALSGRGTGMDVVLARVRSLGGRAALATTPGGGTAITLQLPMSIAIVRALLVRAGEATFAIPVRACVETRRLDPWARVHAERARYRLDDATVPYVSLHAALGLAAPRDAGQVVVVRGAAGRTAVHVDACLVQRDVVVKPLPRVRGAAAFASGATLLADGTPALLLDPEHL